MIEFQGGCDKTVAKPSARQDPHQPQGGYILWGGYRSESIPPKDNPMRVLIQRVDEASVSVEGEVIGSIGLGMVALVGVGRKDRSEDASALAAKLVGLRIFPDAEGRFNLSLLDVGGAMLVVSQFTLYSDVRRGRRPSFTDAARPEPAARLVDEFSEAVRKHGISVATGRFGAMMEVCLTNNGPFTLMVETANGRVVG